MDGATVVVAAAATWPRDGKEVYVDIIITTAVIECWFSITELYTLRSVFYGQRVQEVFVSCGRLLKFNKSKETIWPDKKWVSEWVRGALNKLT